MAGGALTTRTAGPARLRYRQTPRPEDVAAVRRLAARTGVFTAAECKVAGELVDERVRLGRRSGYYFVFADAEGCPAGYAAWGPIPMTAESYDLYWIVVDPRFQGRGLGRDLLARAERAIAASGGRRIYIETSSKPRYARTRRFYRRAGYRLAARFEDFYAAGDHKVVFCKTLIQKE